MARPRVRCRRGAAGDPPARPQRRLQRRSQRERRDAAEAPPPIAYHSRGRHLLLKACQFRHYSCRARDFALRRSGSQPPPRLPLASLCSRPTHWTSRALWHFTSNIALRVGFISKKRRNGFRLSSGSMVQKPTSLLTSRKNSSQLPSGPRGANFPLTTLTVRATSRATRISP